MSQEKNKKISIRQQGVAWFFVFLMSGSFLFGEKVLAVNDYTKATGLTSTATNWNSVASNYDKTINGTLSAFEWNGLAYDFVKTWATSTMVGPLGIGTAASSAYKLDINGLVRATSFTGSYVGTLNSANVSSGDFGTNTGGGNYSFPGKLGIGTTNPGAKLDIVGGVIRAGNGDAYNAIVLQDGNGNNAFRGIRTTVYWPDSANSTAFQVGASGDNIVFTTYGSSVAPRILMHTNSFHINNFRFFIVF